MNELETQQDCAAERRYKKSMHLLKEKRKARDDGKWEAVEEKSRIIQRAITLGKETLAIEALQNPSINILERLIGESELLPSSFLYTGTAKLRTVGRILVRTSSGSGVGTGFLVSRRLLMTNNHVLSSIDDARHSLIQFNYFEKGSGRLAPVEVFRFQPDLFFLTDRRLDCTLIAVEEQNDEGNPLAERGWNQLITPSGKALIGDRVNIVQHPRGRPQEISLRGNKVVNVMEDFLHYETDTEKGSSGSPVFNEQWQIAALHHAGVPKRDESGNFVEWIANEGTRISSIMRFLETVKPRLSEIRQQYLQGIREAPPSIYVRWEEYLRKESTLQVEEVLQQKGQAHWIIPLHVRVGVGEIATVRSGFPSKLSSEIPEANTIGTGTSIEDHILELIKAFVDKPYYDEKKDKADRGAYYSSISGRLSKTNFFKKLSALVQETHKHEFRYRTAKNDFLYPWVDLHEADDGRELRSIYSNHEQSSEEVLRQDFELEKQLIGIEYSLLTPQEIEERLDILETDRHFNCEHVVPQSWFNEKEPMRGDLHHLFTCEEKCNSFRDSIPFFEFTDKVFLNSRDELVQCGRREQYSDTIRKFEPVHGKGPVARATLYFLLRYPGKIGDEARELQKERLPVLINWHKKNPPEIYEWHRNAAIFELQGNRNPLIDHPEWIDRLDFTLGFGE